MGKTSLWFSLWPSKFVWADLIGAKSYQNLVLFFQPNWRLLWQLAEGNRGWKHNCRLKKISFKLEKKHDRLLKLANELSIFLICKHIFKLWPAEQMLLRKSFEVFLLLLRPTLHYSQQQKIDPSKNYYSHYEIAVCHPFTTVKLKLDSDETKILWKCDCFWCTFLIHKYILIMQI